MHSMKRKEGGIATGRREREREREREDDMIEKIHGRSTRVA